VKLGVERGKSKSEEEISKIEQMSIDKIEGFEMGVVLLWMDIEYIRLKIGLPPSQCQQLVESVYEILVFLCHV
jgi:hypothetical protein